MRTAVAAALLVALLAGCDPPKPNASGGIPVDRFDAEVDGVVFAQKHIKPLLKSPSTAEFSNGKAQRTNTVTNAAGIEEELWVVAGTLDAKNAFGVPLRHKWKTIVSRAGNAPKSECAAVLLDDKVVYSRPGFEEMLTEKDDERKAKEKASQDAIAKAKADEVKADRDAKAKSAVDAADKKRRDEKPARDESEAASLLTIARELAKAGKVEKARERLEKIVKDYPETKAAAEAREALKKL